MNAFKKIFSLIMVVAMLTVVFTSCDVINGLIGGEECQHTYDDKWSTDATNHWHAATCEHTELKDGLGAHSDGNTDGKCDTCNYTMSTAGTGNNSSANNTPKVVTYTVIVKNPAGAPVSGAKVILISENGYYTSAKTTDAQGKATFALEEGEWTAALAEEVEGYTSTTDERFAVENGSATINLK